MYLPFPPQIQIAQSPILQPWRSLQHRELALAGIPYNPAPEAEDDGNDDYDDDATVDEEEWEQEQARREREKWYYDEEE
jgi:hypothetical protein